MLQIKETLSSAFCGFIDLLLPPLCPLCRVSLEAIGLCRTCLDSFTPIKGPSCIRCAKPFVSSKSVAHHCATCIKTPPHFSRASSAFVYKKGAAKAVKAFKFGGELSMAKPLGVFTAEAASLLFKEQSRCDGVVVPVPLHKKRLRERGFNQSLAIASYVARTLELPLASSALARIRNTAPQTGLNGTQRNGNVKGAFAANDNKRLKRRTVILVDDVFTTGATANECSRVLKRAGADEILVATLARTSSL